MGGSSAKRTRQEQMRKTGNKKGFKTIKGGRWFRKSRVNKH